ncbi:DgyrCDS8348 [Dimorphilus gyrociliatus]|uniref:DgyrCDS8348 n=1 Tax=Dimorphilus gyrociliatus TaxID=2664684 RepID=A0A7I8VW29_9ANNE|nr:DgyrCDS8348 [Dimorphilus gyrociliatus]
MSKINVLLGILGVIVAIFAIFRPTNNPPLNYHIFTEPGFEKVAEIFINEVKNGNIQGANFAAYHKGKLIVNLVGGYADKETRNPWTFDTITQVFSSTKGVAMTALNHLQSKGLLDYDQPISKYWPEFSQNGKSNITIKHLLTHTAGMAIIEKTWDPKDLLENYTKVSEIFAEQKPSWPAGTKIGYHGLTTGVLVDNIVRRVDLSHRSLSDYVAEEFSFPYQLDLYLGLPLTENYRTAKFYEVNIPNLDMFTTGRKYLSIFLNLIKPGSLTNAALTNPIEYLQSYWLNNPYNRAIPDGSLMGFSNAQTLAKFYSLILSGEILNKEFAKDLNKPLVKGRNIIVDIEPSQISYGYFLIKAPHGGLIFGHPGTGGQAAFADPKFDLSLSYITNYHSLYGLGDDPRFLLLSSAVYDCIKNL